MGSLDSRRHKEYSGWLNEQLLYWRPLDVTVETSVFYAEIRTDLKRQGRPIPENDLWIAALARQHGLAVLSRDAHFDAVAGLTRLSW